MKKIFKRTVSLVLAVSLTAALGLPAAASDALGEDLTEREVLLNKDTELTTNVFWSSAYSDLRTENYITYEPNRSVTPIVTYGDALTERHTVTAMARELEEDYRVVAGVNGDFYNVGTGLPIGLVITDGILRSSDGGYHAIGFKKDGEAVLGKPGVKVTAELGYEAYDEYGSPVEMTRPIAAVNKARVSTGGIYLYTHDFNAKHTTGTTEPGVDVICSVKKGSLAIGETLKLTVEQVLEGASATPVGEEQVVLSVNEKSDLYHLNALRGIPIGATVTLKIETADEAWEDVEYAVGSLYSLVEDGAEVSGLPSGASPRTAVGQKRDGTLIFYTVDGRRSGHSVGASLSQVAQRLIELGCETALCLDGGGSTTLAVTSPDSLEAAVINRPSEGGERAVTNQIFLVADNEPSGQLKRFYVSAEHTHVLAGSRVKISAAPVDINHIPMDTSYRLEADEGEMEDDILITPDYDAAITVTAFRNGKEGSTTVYSVEEPDDIAVQNGNGKVITELAVTPGSVTELTAAVSWNHLPLYADAELFDWDVKGNVGRIDENGVFTALNPGEGTITVSAGGVETEVEVTVSRVPLKTVEDFEDEDTIFTEGSGNPALFTTVTGSEQVRMGRGAGRLDYVLAEELGYAAEWRNWSAAEEITIPYNSLNLWVCGDGSGNQLSLLYANDTKGYLELPVAILSFTGWQQVSVELPYENFTIQGLKVSAGAPYVYDDGLGNLVREYPMTARTGTVYLDHMVASLGGTVDNEVPEIEAELDGEDWVIRAEVHDAVDEILEKDAISVSYNGEEMEFDYNRKTGEVEVYLPGPGESYEAMRVTVTARDASGNIGRASVDVEPFGVEHKFTDIADYPDAVCVDFLYNSGVTKGFEDGSFRPNQNITRAQFAVMLYRYLGMEEEKYADVVLPFADLASIGEYAIPAIRALYTEGIINGSVGRDGRLYFNPHNNLTRAQVVSIVGRTQEKGYATADVWFADSANIPAYAVYYIQTLTAQGVVGGYADGTFRPYELITRGQMAKLLYHIM